MGPTYAEPTETALITALFAISPSMFKLVEEADPRAFIGNRELNVKQEQGDDCEALVVSADRQLMLTPRLSVRYWMLVQRTVHRAR